MDVKGKTKKHLRIRGLHTFGKGKMENGRWRIIFSLN